MKNRLVKMMSLYMSMMLLVMMLPACSGQGDSSDTEDEIVSEDEVSIDESADDEQLGVDPNTGEPIESVDIAALGGDGADVDISKLSSTMVYSVVYDMTTRPNEYIGKTIRMKGNMSTYHDEETGKTYYACLIEDATACCAQGIEFQTTDEFKTSDYPAEGEPVTVLGRYDMYEEDGFEYCILKDAVLE